MDRKNFIGMSSFQFMAATRRGLFYGFLTLYVLEVLHRTFTEAMLVMALPMLANSLTQPFIWGPLSDKMGTRKLFIALGETIAGIAYILLSPPVWSLFTGMPHTQAASLYTIFLIVGLTLLESFWSMSNVAWSALLADLTIRETRGTVVGGLYSIEAIGRIVGVFLGGALYDYPSKAAGFPYLFYISSIIMFSSALVILLTIEERGIGGRMSYKEQVEVKFEGAPIFYTFLLAIMFISISTASIRRILNYYLRLALLATSFEMSLISNVASITQLITNPLIGKLSDVKGRVPVLGIGFLLAIAIPILYTIPRELLWLIPVSALAGIIRVISMTVAYSYVADIIPENARGKYFGQYNMARTISFGVVPIVTAGLLPDFWEANLLRRGYDAVSAEIIAMINVFYLASVISLIGFVMFWIHSIVKKRMITLQ
ncbi:MAG: MFS transporter [Candidatus Njordarchaeales archaeon]